jgi:hypothetical protein
MFPILLNKIKQMEIKNKFLFNFAVSYSGGGVKRLTEFAKWFNQNGGAWFIIHPNCDNIVRQFPNNHYFFVNQKRWERVLCDWRYLADIQRQIGVPKLYYSYGIPVYKRIGEVNWFHLSNVLPLVMREIPMSLSLIIKMKFLAFRIRQNYRNADIISAESQYALNLIESDQAQKLKLLVNGSDDELAVLKTGVPDKKHLIATVVGTYKYKALMDSLHVFNFLRQKDPGLKLIIIGAHDSIPAAMKKSAEVTCMGLVARSVVIETLRRSKYYISTTRIENSYNAASEGIFFADESYISDIGPHRELLAGLPFNEMAVLGIDRKLLYVQRQNVSGVNLKSWDGVIQDMLQTVKDMI